MSQAEALLRSLNSEAVTEYTYSSNEEPYIVIGDDRIIQVPDSLKRLAVQYDHNIETVTFDCPRFWDNHDLSEMRVYVNYRTADATLGSYPVPNVTVLGDRMQFDWVISGNVTKARGNIAFLVCVSKTDDDGVVANYWNSELCTECYISQGMKASETILIENSDTITFLLTRMDEVNAIATPEAMQEYANTWLDNNYDSAIAELDQKVDNAMLSLDLKTQTALNTIPDSYTETYNAAQEAIRTKADAVMKTVSGECNLTPHNTSNDHIKGLRLFGKTNQIPYEGVEGSPSPNYPATLASVENAKIYIRSKNLIPEPTIGTTNTVNGITYEYEGNGVYHIHGTYTGTTTAAAMAHINIYLPVDLYTPYTLSAKLLSGTCTNQFHFFIGLRTNTVSNRNWMSVPINASTPIGEVVTITQRPIDNNADSTMLGQFWIYTYNENLINFTTDFRVQVWAEVGDKSTEHHPYSEQELQSKYVLAGIPVANNGTYTDSDGQRWICDELDFERCVYIQRTGVKTFDGSDDEIWYDEIDLTNTTMFRIEIPDSANVGNISAHDFICDRFVVNQIYNGDRVGAQHTMRQFYFRIDNSALDSIDLVGWKAWLAENPVTVRYVLGAPVEIPMDGTEEYHKFLELRTAYQNTTVVNNVNAYMEMKYVADTTLYIDEMSDNIDDDRIQAAVDNWLEAHFTSAEGVRF